MSNTNIAWMFTLYEVGRKVGSWLGRLRPIRKRQALRQKTVG